MNLSTFIINEGTTITKVAGEHVFRQGDEDKSLYLIKQGLLKAYYVSAQGKESIKSFIQSDNIIGSLYTAYTQHKNPFSLVCLEPTTLVKFDFNRLVEQSQHDHELANSLIEILLQLSMKKEKRERELLCLSAEQRYQLLKEQSPQLLEKVTQNDIARYLGITPVGLSRIKRRVKGQM